MNFNGKTEIDKNVIHLFILNECDHKCPLCCNNQYDIKSIPVVSVYELETATDVCITGGEPFLYKDLARFVRKLRRQYPNIEHVYVYTSSGAVFENWCFSNELDVFDGYNFCPKNSRDMKLLKRVLDAFIDDISSTYSNRIYAYPDLIDQICELDLPANTEVIPREWQEEFEPGGGIFRRLPVLV